MAAAAPHFRAHLTLGLCTLLHAFTHALATMLVPLYLMIQQDLHLRGVRSAALIVSIYGIVYSLGSYAAGVLTDRMDRKLLLGLALLGNALAIAVMGLTHHYLALLALGAMAGIFGTVFHPAANALVAGHYPKSPGMAIGLLGMGSGIGFFFGPWYAGMRASATHDWQRPCLELGMAGLVAGVLFLLLGAETIDAPHISPPPPTGDGLRRRVAALAAVLCFRDFAGVAILSLASIYLQKGLHKSVLEAGVICGAMMLPSALINPLCVYLSPGKRRLPALTIILICAGLIVVTTPFWPAALVLAALCGFQTLQLGSCAVSDAAMLERVAPRVRGRAVGLYMVLAGTFASTSPWIMGFWTDLLGKRAEHPPGYIGPFALMGILMLIAAFSPPLIARLGPTPEKSDISPGEEVSPRTMEIM